MVLTAAAATLIGAGIVGGSSLLGGFGSSALSYSQSRKLQNAQNEWMERMANTAHQREVEDLKKAGLNPILSAGGTGAATPQSGSASQPLADLDPTSAYLAYKQYKRESKLTNSQIDLNEKSGEAQSANAFYTKAQGDLSNFEYNLQKKYGPLIKQQELKNLSLQGDAIKSQIVSNMANADVASSSAKNYKLQNSLIEPEIEWNRKHPFQKQITTGIGRWTGSIGNILRGSANFGVKK